MIKIDFGIHIKPTVATCVQFYIFPDERKCLKNIIISFKDKQKKKVIICSIYANILGKITKWLILNCSLNLCFGTPFGKQG